MEPLDPELARLVHDGMVQAVPGPEVEDRVLRGLLARLPHGGPPGSEGHDLRGGSSTPMAAKAGATAGGKAWALVAVLGVTAVTGGLVLGGRREPERQGVVARERVREGSAASTSGEPVVGERSMEAPGAESASTKAGGSGTSTSFVPPDSPSKGSSSRAVSSSVNESPHPPGETAADRAAVDPVPVPTTDDLAAEIQQVAAADRALARGEFRRALQLAREHASTHPHGQLVHERTAIELAARCQLGEPGAAEAAASFLRQHGDAPAAAKVRARCGAPK